MNADHFRLPIRIVARDGEPVTEIYGAGEALDFLLAWPHQKGPVFQQAVNACFVATVDGNTVDTAQTAFRRFAWLSGILSKDMQPVPSRRGRQAAQHNA